MAENPLSGRGLLEVRVTGGNGAFPIENAAVHISAFSEGAPLLYSLRTNENGSTGTVSLPTPPRNDSLSPNGKTPYSQYVVTVKKNGFYTTENIGLPMFDGITSIQKVDLLPLSESDSSSPIAAERVFFENDGYASLRGIRGPLREGDKLER